MLKDKYQIKVGALLSYVSIFANIILGLLYTPWMVEQIGKSDYGLYTLANSLITLFMVDFGLSSATSRYVAKYRTENNREGLKIFLNSVYKLYLLIDIFIFVLLLIVFFNINGIYNNLSVEEIEKLKVVFCIASVYSLIHFPCVTFNGILTAYEEFIPLKVADLIYRVAVVIVTVICLILGGGLYSVVLVNAICGLCSVAIKYYFVRKNLGFSIDLKSKTRNKKIYTELFQFSMWTTLTSLASRLVFNITPSILGMVYSGAIGAIAVFGMITTIEGYTYTLTTALNGMFLSKITRIVNTKDTSRQELTKLTIDVGRFQFLLNGIIVVGFTVIGKEFIFLWMGEDFIDGYYGILFIIFPGLFYNSLQIANTTMIVKNMVKYQSMVAIATGICNVVLSVILSHKWGVLGASMAICIAYSLRVVLNLIVIKKKLNIDLIEFIKKCYLRLSIPIFIALLLSFYVTRSFPSGGWISLAIKAFIILIIYLICVITIGLTRQEIKLLFKKIGI